jgi:hypothetical protein
MKITYEFDSQNEVDSWVLGQAAKLRPLDDLWTEDVLAPGAEMVAAAAEEAVAQMEEHIAATGETVSEAVNRVMPEVLAQGAEIAALKGNTRRRRCKECNELFPTPELNHGMCAGCTVATAPEPEQEPRPELTVVAAPPSEVSIDKVRAAFAAVVAKNYNTAADILTDLGAGTFDEVVAAGNVEQLAAALG